MGGILTMDTYGTRLMLTIREYTKQYARKSDALGGLSFFASFATYFAALILGAVYLGHVWLSLPMIVVLAFASVRLYVLQHDCGHYSLFKTKAWNDWAGYALSVVSLTPFRVMQYNHNLHHAHLGDLEHRETTEVFTMTKKEFQEAGTLRRLSYRIYRNPVVMLSLGGIYAYFIVYRWPANTRKVGVTGVLIHNALVFTYVWLVWSLFAWPGLIVLGTSAILAGVIGVFLVYLQHNFEDTYWDRKPDHEFQKATLEGSSSLDLGHWWDIGTGNIAYHDLHHFAPGIPSYRLRYCQNNLPKHLRTKHVIRWPEAIASFRLKVWDEDARKMAPFPPSRRAQVVAAE